MGMCVHVKGNNCEKCLPYQYRPSDREQSSLDPCVACNCTGPGVATGTDPLNSDTGHCVMNDEVASSLPDKVNGFVYLF